MTTLFFILFFRWIGAKTIFTGKPKKTSQRHVTPMWQGSESYFERPKTRVILPSYIWEGEFTLLRVSIVETQGQK